MIHTIIFNNQGQNTMKIGMRLAMKIRNSVYSKKLNTNFKEFICVQEIHGKVIFSQLFAFTTNVSKKHMSTS